MDVIRWELCTEKDIPVLNRLGMDSYWENYRYLWTDDKYAHWYMNMSFSVQSLDKQLRDPAASFYLVYDGQMPSGLLKLNRGKHWNGEVGDFTELEKIYLLKSSSGKGLGTRAVAEIVAHEKQRNCEAIWLKSMDSSPARGFYKKTGFREVAVERLPYEGFKEIYRNMVVMERTL